MSIKRGGSPLRVYYNAEFGWCIDVPTPVSAAMIRAAAEWSYKMNLDKWRSMRPGDQKDRLGAALPSLREGKIRQVIKERYFEIETE